MCPTEEVPRPSARGVAGGRSLWTPRRAGITIRFMRLVPRTRSSIGLLRWWLLPGPFHMMGDLAGVIVAASLAEFGKDHDHAWLEVAGNAVALVFVIPVMVAGWRLIIRSLLVDPLRAYLIRRNTGENVYFRNGVMRRKPRHRAAETSVRARPKQNPVSIIEVSEKSAKRPATDDDSRQQTTNRQ